ncbi:MAG: hypothetical protein QM733_00145 [Ilumatobacteraceae bacterium]
MPTRSGVGLDEVGDAAPVTDGLGGDALDDVGGGRGLGDQVGWTASSWRRVTSW